MCAVQSDWSMDSSGKSRLHARQLQSGGFSVQSSAKKLLKDRNARLRASINWALRHYRKGRPDLAIEELSRIRSVDPNNLAVAEQIARLHLEMGDPAAACRRYLLAEAAQKDPASALNNLGVLMYNFGRYSHAAAIFERAASLNISAPKVVCNWALALFRLGNAEKARMLYSDVLAACPDDDHAHYLLGIALERAGPSPETRPLMPGDVIFITPCAQVMAAHEEAESYPSRVVAVDGSTLRVAVPLSDRRRVFVPALTDLFIGRPADSAFFGMITKVRGRANSPEPVLLVDNHDQIKIHHRKFRRIRSGLSIAAAWQSADNLRFGLCSALYEIDLSAGGIRFTTSTPVDRAMSFDITFTIGFRRFLIESHPVRIRSCPDNLLDVRLKFTSLDPADQEWLNGQLQLLKTLREST
jgi:tetratricopeptide (TPR) repeat protein